MEIQSLLIDSRSLYGIVCYATMEDDLPFQVYLVAKLLNFKKNSHRILDAMASLNGLKNEDHIKSMQKKIKKMRDDIQLHNKILKIQ
jgi:hypothetical protein